jgi:hypothetical protein
MRTYLTFGLIEMGKSVPRNALCPCGSGKKYKQCCLAKDGKMKQGKRKTASFSFDDGSTVNREILSLDSIPTHNIDGLTPNISKQQMMDMVLDEFFRILSTEQVGMLADMTNRIVAEMNIIPVFTYRELGNALAADPRFDHYCMQVVCLAGNDPMELLIG